MKILMTAMIVIFCLESKVNARPIKRMGETPISKTLKKPNIIRIGERNPRVRYKVGDGIKHIKRMQELRKKTAEEKKEKKDPVAPKKQCRIPFRCIRR